MMVGGSFACKLTLNDLFRYGQPWKHWVVKGGTGPTTWSTSRRCVSFPTAFGRTQQFVSVRNVFSRSWTICKTRFQTWPRGFRYEGARTSSSTTLDKSTPHAILQGLAFVGSAAPVRQCMSLPNLSYILTDNSNRVMGILQVQVRVQGQFTLILPQEAPPFLWEHEAVAYECAGYWRWSVGILWTCQGPTESYRH